MMKASNCGVRDKPGALSLDSEAEVMCPGGENSCFCCLCRGGLFLPLSEFCFHRCC